MRPDEVRGLGALAGMALGGGVQRVAQAHAGIAGRVFGAVGSATAGSSRPVQVVHDAVSTAVYGAVQGTLTAGARAAGLAAATRASGGPALADRPGTRIALGVLNGAHGDALAERAQALALPMTLRHAGTDLPPERDALAAAHPQATERLVVFLHGLVETEDSWRPRRDPGSGFGDRLQRDLGRTPVWVRYNTGLHIAANGRALADLLERLVAAWPVPVQELALVGHSMGGLVARSALAQAGTAGWPARVSTTVTLGSPHLGAPLEQGVVRLAGVLRALPETRWLAEQLDARSVGIKDLQHGTLVEVDPLHGRTPLPLHSGPRHCTVLATVAGAHDSRAGRLLGDLLVRPDSATGASADEHALAYEGDAVVRLTGLHHFDLLTHDEVYAALLRWLRDPDTLPTAPRAPDVRAALD